MLNELQFVSFVGNHGVPATVSIFERDNEQDSVLMHQRRQQCNIPESIFLVMRSNHHITLSRISNDMNFFDNVKTFLFSLGNTMWLDPLVERTYLETINVTTNNLNIRMELLEEKLAADNKQVLMS